MRRERNVDYPPLLGDNADDHQSPTNEIPHITSPRWMCTYVIELALSMYFFASVLALPISQFYVYNQVAKSYGIPNYIKNDDTSICDSKNNSEATKVISNIQKESSQQLMYMSFLSSFTAIIPTFFLGYISDRCGRKVSFLITLIGLLLHQIVYIVVFYLEAPLPYLYIGNTLEGITGYMSCAVMTAFIMLADVTSPGQERGFRIALMEGIMASSAALALLGGGFWIKYSGFLIPMLCSTGLTVLTIIVWVFAVPETRPFREDHSHSGISLNTIKRCFVFYYEKTSQNRRGKMLVLLLILVIAATCFLSKTNVVTLFLLGQPFCWSEVHISVVFSLQILINWVVGIIFLRLVLRVMRDVNLLSFGCFIGMVSFIPLALAKSDWMIYLYTVIVTFSILVVPISRSILSKLVSPEEQGALFAGVAAMEHLMTACGGLLFGEIYKDTVTIFPGLVFLVIAGLVMIALILSWLLCLLMREWHGREMDVTIKNES
ncbi:lysosomal proton-coupled steroid conjugate and bile acid symporter SLC46A3-like [Ylistrum balloti]|uniref:lysosomal proton-coupled steroid conjugate and bile acid symporter SLC46A3-like n=1 Tax=Ylistrum balloti TaxID=509963 RepID=UPI002905BA5D|nr:lysosomal proton-coupled steroid conjugate and bile acid symporter SLC46A3-like [Ylistrum balloti]